MKNPSFSTNIEFPLAGGLQVKMTFDPINQDAATLIQESLSKFYGADGLDAASMIAVLVNVALCTEVIESKYFNEFGGFEKFIGVKMKRYEAEKASLKHNGNG